MEKKKSLPENEICKVPCEYCDQITNHQVLAAVEEDIHSPDNDYQSTHYWKIIQCCGCETISLFKNYHDNQDLIYFDEHGTYEYEDHIELFPPRIAGRKKLKNIYELPNNVRKMYEETLLAICSKQHILAGIGIRALIELICNESNANGKNLENKIKDLKNNNLISGEEEKLLHNSRLFGNIAAHEVVPLPVEILDTLFEISEHMLKSIYILPTKNEKLKKILESRKFKK